MTSTTSSTSSRRAKARRSARRKESTRGANAVGLVGIGRLGSYVLHRLRARGIAVRARRGDDAGLARTRVVYLCVPEDRLPEISARLARAWRDGPRPRAVLHAAGNLGSDALAPLAKLGIGVGVLHPMRAFSRRAGREHVRAVQNCWTCSGDAAVLAQARWLVRQLEPRAQVWALPDDAGARRLYHAGCVLANNGGLALHQLAAKLLAGAGLAPEAADQGAAALLNSAVFRGSRGRVLDGAVQLRGPLARGQLQVVREHVAALGRASRAGHAYRVLSLELLELAQRGKRLDRRTVAAFERALR
ncbi:MAG: DUF2520 domain-containing protein [Planctomycetota bacterium]|nr:MAG: DUF2520 domain-containing protein [Planctomycetota bacterium]